MKILPKELAKAFYAAARDASEKDLPQMVKSFVALAKERGFTAMLPAVLAALPSVAEAEEASRRVTVTTARKLDAATLSAALKAAGIGTEGREVVNVEDPNVIGGIKIKTVDTVIDATVSKQLAELKRNFSK